MLFFEAPGMALVRIISNFWMSLFTAFSLPALTVFLLHCCEENWRKSPLFRAALVLYGLFFMLIVITQFTSSIYYVSPDGHLHFEPLYPLVIAPLVAIGLINLAGLIRRRNRLSRKYFLAMLISMLSLTAALIVHLFVPVFPLIDISITTFALLMYGIILTDQIEQYMHQQQEIANRAL